METLVALCSLTFLQNKNFSCKRLKKIIEYRNVYKKSHYTYYNSKSATLKLLYDFDNQKSVMFCVSNISGCISQQVL